MRAVIVLTTLLLSTSSGLAGMCELRRPPDQGSQQNGQTKWAKEKDIKTLEQCVKAAQKEKQKRYPTQELEIFYESNPVKAEKSRGKRK